MPLVFSIFNGTIDIVAATVVAVASHLLMEDASDLLLEDGTLFLTEV